MKKFISLFVVITILIFSAYLESTYSNNNLYNYPTFPYVEDEPLDEPVSGQAKEDELENMVPSLELKLVDQEEVNGYIVETYREYEVYEDKNENVVKTIPTENYEYIKYKK